MKNVLILSNDKAWKVDFGSAVKMQFTPAELQTQYVGSRTDAITELAQQQFDLFIISKSVPKKEVEMIMRYITTNENFNMNIFFIHDNFDEFQEILKVTQFPKIHLFSTPIEHAEVTKQMRMTLFPISKQMSPNNNLKINLEFLKAFVDASKYIFEAFCTLKEISHQKPMLLTDENRKTYDLEGHIHLQSDLFEGIFYVCFAKDTYLNIIEHVLMEKYSDITPANIDFVGEIVNMIYGQSKIHLNQSGHNFKKVIPQFTQNPPPHKTSNMVTVVPIKTEIGTIDLKIEIISKI